MKIEIELTEKSRERNANPLDLGEDFPADLEFMRIAYNVNVGRRKTLDFAILIPYREGIADELGDEFLRDVAENSFRATLESSVHNEAIVNRVKRWAERSERDAFEALADGKIQKAANLANLNVNLNAILKTKRRDPFRAFIRLARRAIGNQNINVEDWNK